MAGAEGHGIGISFIVCTYHRADLLERCLRSLLAVAGEDIEVIVNDNASPDQTVEVVGRFTDRRLRYHRQDRNIGMTTNFLHAVTRARGAWLFIITDDDVLDPATIVTLRPVLRANPDVGLILSAIQNARPTGEPCGGLLGPADHDLHLSPGPRSAAIIGRWAFVLSRQVIRRTALDLAFYRQATAYAYFCSIVAARIALDHPTIYLHRVMVLHTVDNLQHWEEWGGERSEVYFRTHMDDSRTLAVAFDAAGVGAARLRRRWVARVLADYAKLPLAAGLIGFIARRGVMAGASALRTRLPLRWWPWLLCHLIWSVGRRALKGALRPAFRALGLG